ncbi:carbohydrate ABC transporter permease [Enterococcus sp. LJL98]
MKKKEFQLTGSDKSLKVTAIIITILSAIVILFPFALTVSNAMKDNARIYDSPPRLLPEAAQSLSLVVDYSQVGMMSNDELESLIQTDMISSLFGIYTKLNRESIFETRFYGVKDGKTIFSSRVHQVQLQMEKDYGVFKGVVLKNQTIRYKNRTEKAANQLGYIFDANGLKDVTAPDSLQKDTFDKVYPVLTEKFKTDGELIAVSQKRNNWLLLESFVHYMKLPKYIYGKNPTIAKYGFMVFVLNTIIVITFAIVAQTLLCSISAFVISHLLSPRAGRMVLLYFLGAMMIPFVSIMLPQLIMYKDMGAYNNYAALLLPFLYPYGFYVFLFKGFFDRIPSAFFEAARLDGASNFYLYSKICMPLSKPIISMIALQTFLGNWNDFFWAWLVTERQDRWTLNVALYNIANNAGTKQNALMGIAFVTILPVIIVTLLFSKQLKASIMSSGVKG